MEARVLANFNYARLERIFMSLDEFVFAKQRHNARRTKGTEIQVRID